MSDPDKELGVSLNLVLPLKSVRLNLNLWSFGKNRWCPIKINLPLYNQQKSVLKLQVKEARPVCVPSSLIPSSGKSLIVHIKTARSVNISFFECQMFLNSQILWWVVLSGHQCHSCHLFTKNYHREDKGGLLHTLPRRAIVWYEDHCHILWLVLMFPKRFKPSVANPNRTFQGSSTNSGCNRLNVFQASESLGCLINSS